MNNVNRDIQYLYKNLTDKKELNTEELSKFILYDLYLKHPDEVKNVIKNNDTIIMKEYDDILPKLIAYQNQKELYGKHKDKDLLITSTREMLKEIIDLLTELHKNCDIQEERDLFKKAFTLINKI